MSNNMVSPIETLPVELLHRIFDNLDSETILFSIRPVCRLFRSIVSTYNQYVLNFQLISKSHFYLFCRLIKPENVISIILSNNERTSDQIKLFISLVRLRQFTRLRSLTLLNIDEEQLNFILKRIKLNTIISFSFTIRKYDGRRIKTTAALLSSVAASSTFRRLESDINSRRMSNISWPINCTIQYLTLNNYISIDHFYTILQNSPHLHTLSMSDIPVFENSSIFFPQIKSFTTTGLYIPIDKLEPFLLLTPSLVYLKLIGGKKMMDGKRWEQFIQIHLSQLDKFEFYFDEFKLPMPTAADVELIIASFQTPFWIEHKRWFVVCQFKKNSRNLELYSLPLCKSSVYYVPESEKISSSTYSITMNNDRSIMNNIKSLALTWDKATVDDIQEKKTSNHPLFPNVTKIDLHFCDDWPVLSLQTLSMFIDISRIIQMTFFSQNFSQYNENAWTDMGIFMKQAYNLSSLTIQNNFRWLICRTIENIHSILPHHVKHLQIPIANLNQLKMIVEQCESLSTANFDTENTEFGKQVIQWFADNTINTSCREDYRMVSVWFGKKIIQSTEANHNSKRIKLTENCTNS